MFSDEELAFHNKLMRYANSWQQDDQPQYPRRQRRLPVTHGIDEYIDMAFLSEAAEDPESIEEALQS